MQVEKKLTKIQRQNHDRILTAAMTIFSRYGYRGTTVDQIATEADMSKANLLYYYRRKQDIYIAVLENTLDQWLRPLQTLDPDGNPADELWRYTREKLALSRQSPEASRLFANEILQGAPMINPFLSTDLKALVDTKCSIIRHWIEQKRLIDIEPIHLLFLIWAATQHYADFRTQIDALFDGSESELYAGAEKTLRAVLNGLIPGDSV